MPTNAKPPLNKTQVNSVHPFRWLHGLRGICVHTEYRQPTRLLNQLFFQYLHLVQLVVLWQKIESIPGRVGWCPYIKMIEFWNSNENLTPQLLRITFVFESDPKSIIIPYSITVSFHSCWPATIPISCHCKWPAFHYQLLSLLMGYLPFQSPATAGGLPSITISNHHYHLLSPLPSHFITANFPALQLYFGSSTL